MAQDKIRYFEVSGYEITSEKTVITGYARNYQSGYNGSIEAPAIIVFYQNKPGTALLSRFLHHQKIVQEGLAEGEIKTWGDALVSIVGTFVQVPGGMIRFMV